MLFKQLKKKINEIFNLQKVRGKEVDQKSHKGFTLIELLITVAIVAVLMTVTVVALNPAEYLKKSRDIKRITDLTNLQLALQIVAADKSISMGVCDGTKIYASVPSETPLSNDNLPSGVSWVQVSQANLMKTDGTGWIPIDFNSFASKGIRLPALPIDPKNSVNDYLFYTYTCNSNRQFVLTAWFESQYFGPKGQDPKSKSDGGPDPYLYEVGSNLFIHPLKPVGYWPLDEGYGSTTADLSGNNVNMQVKNLVNWVDGVSGKAVQMDPSISTSCVNQDAGVYTGTIPNNIVSLPSYKFTYEWLNNLSQNSGATRVHLPAVLISGCGYCSIWTQLSYIWIANSAQQNSSISYSAPSTNNWHHFIFTFDKPNLNAKLYIDNSLAGQANLISGSDYGTVQWLSFGVYHPTCVDSTPGEKIDEVLLYNRTLSTAEINRHYQLIK